MAARDLSRFIGRSPDSLSWKERIELDGVWVAFEIYSPLKLPLRRFEAVGESAAECRRQIESRGGSPTDFEYVPFVNVN